MAIEDWPHLDSFGPRKYTCGYCNVSVGASRGYSRSTPAGVERVIICPHCERPSYFFGELQVPGVAFGNPVASLPVEVEALYAEARNCMVVNAFTSAVMACRKLLMHVAVSQGGSPSASFKAQVDYLDSNGFLPRNSKKWVDHIRDRGNEANHEIHMMNRQDAEALLVFIEMLLKLVYEFPAKVP